MKLERVFKNATRQASAIAALFVPKGVSCGHPSMASLRRQLCTAVHAAIQHQGCCDFRSGDRVALPLRLRYRFAMDFDQLLVRFFGTAEIDSLSPEQLLGGVERLRLQFALEKDAERRFAYWCLLFMLGAAPDLEEAFDDEGDREAAREFMETAEREIDGDD